MQVAILRILVFAVVAYAVASGLLWAVQERLVFPAPRSSLISPSRAGLPRGESVRVVTQDSVTLTGWFIPAESEDPAPALLWFHGNGETVPWLAPVIGRLMHPGYAILILNYRGYGDSGGRATERGIYLDADAAWSYLAQRPEVDSSRVAVYGRSIGSAPAMHVASNHAVRAVVLDSPITNARDMARKHYRIFPAFLVRMRLDNVSKMAQLDAPVLVFHGDRDMIAPTWMGRELAGAARNGEFVLIEGAGHNETFDVGGRAYVERVHSFLSRHLEIE
ncbi:MAG: alpha/beta hydrolase [Gemmatimonadales bacterium]